MSMYKVISQKIYLDPKKEFNCHIQNFHKYLDTGISPDTWIVNTQEQLDTICEYLEKNDIASISQGIHGGCYGARDGKHYNGVQLWVDALQLPDRWLETDTYNDTEEVTEWINPAHLLEEHAEYLDEVSEEAFDQLSEALNLEIKHDNTYNFYGNNSEDGALLFDLDFKTIRTEEFGDIIFSVMFHYGGDPRGNYSSRYVFKAGYDDFYSIFAPQCYLKDDDNE